MRLKSRAIGLLLALALALALLPAVAVAAPAITQGVQGVIRDGTSGQPIPFAEASLVNSLGVEVEQTPASFDGTYSFEADVDTYTVTARAEGYDTSSTAAFKIVADTVTTRNLTLDRQDAFFMPVYRFFNMVGGVHFYTVDPVEFTYVSGSLPQFKYDGIGYWIPWGPDIAPGEDPGLMKSNTTVLQRFYNVQTGVHFYTADVNEFNNVRNNLSSIYHYDGPAYYVSMMQSGDPIYRFYNVVTGAHFYTANADEIFASIAGPYTYEGVAFYTGYWEQSFSLEYTAGQGGTITGDASQVVAQGREGTPVTAVPNTGYVFTMWDDGNTDATRTDFGEGNLDVQAQFILD